MTDGAAPSAPVEGVFLVDGHSHLYPSYERAAFLDAALANLRAAAARIARGRPFWGCLLFSETARDHAFAELRGRAGSGAGLGAWTFCATEEPEALIARHADGERLILIAGRQIQTAEGLELLALFCAAEFVDGRPLPDVLEAIGAANAVAVVPWGFGKWWLGRGRLLHETLRATPPGALALGDNGGRARGLIPPRALREAARARRRVLPGSDSLPVEGEAARVGSYGFVLEGAIDLMRPAAGLRRVLHAQDGTPPTFGRRVGLARFLRNQIALRLARRRPAAA
jgi:hypothetical protein